MRDGRFGVPDHQKSPFHPGGGQGVIPRFANVSGLANVAKIPSLNKHIPVSLPKPGMLCCHPVRASWDTFYYMELFVTVPHPFESLLARECTQLGATDLRLTQGGVHCTGDLAAAYRLCLWSRLASRVLLPLAKFPCANEQALYDGVRAIPWEDHFTPADTFAIHVTARRSPIQQTHFAALKSKDAVVDRFRERSGQRPSVDTVRPGIRLQIHLDQKEASVALDLSGESLHRRGYRDQGGEAPLKENLAAALLVGAGWSEIAATGAGLCDPLCGSGTFLIEGGLIAGDCAPGLGRERFGFHAWLQFDPATWLALKEEAQARREAGLAKLPPLVGWDGDAKSVQAAQRHASRAGLGGKIEIGCRPLAELRAPGEKIGLVVANPPYGARLESTAVIPPLYRLLGEKLHAHFAGSRALLIAPDDAAGKATGWRAQKVTQFRNGPLNCKLLRIDLDVDNYWPAKPRAVTGGELAGLDEGGAMFANRLRKNLRHLRKLAERERAGCFRVYDADLPEYAVAVDRYGDWAHVQEYAPPAKVDPDKARHRLEQVLRAVPQVLEIPADHVMVKTRQRQKGANQYAKMDDAGQFHETREGDAVFLVNFTDYLDTGVFLDHRPVRALIHDSVRNQRFLNLFAYTATATVQAALGGARRTVSVDTSNTYLEWARRNLARNGFSTQQHRLERADCFDWLAENRDKFDWILLDPPTFSNSKRADQDFDVQRDHARLIHAAMRHLAPGGTLLFSCNLRRFTLAEEALSPFRLEDWTAPSIPFDFARNERIHHCWKITRVKPDDR